SNFIQGRKVPTLIIYSGNNYRVNEPKRIGVFTALQLKGIPSRFLYFEDENHLINESANSLKW
ncbi:hypothetical protein K502DRAFT_281073, partial [Neoconidiobolus thromboides FSU 785]